jgi:hypothetical protein
METNAQFAERINNDSTYQSNLYWNLLRDLEEDYRASIDPDMPIEFCMSKEAFDLYAKLKTLPQGAIAIRVTPVERDMYEIKIFADNQYLDTCILTQVQMETFIRPLPIANPIEAPIDLPF